jgi:hypothetical protein
MYDTCAEYGEIDVEFERKGTVFMNQAFRTGMEQGRLLDHKPCGELLEIYRFNENPGYVWKAGAPRF